MYLHGCPDPGRSISFDLPISHHRSTSLIPNQASPFDPILLARYGNCVLPQVCAMPFYRLVCYTRDVTIGAAMIRTEAFIPILDLGGTFVFAISGAVAALAGASVVVIGDQIGIAYGASATIGGVLCFGLRFMAIRHRWHLPIAHLSAQVRAGIDRSNNTKSE